MLTVQFGQCGNQLGHNLFSKVSSDIKSINTGVSYSTNYEYTEQTIEKWYNGVTKCGKHVARAILVDTEEKVINKIYKDANMSWVYQSSNIVCQSNGGSANNWAYGYRVNSEQLLDITSNVIQQEIEKLDRFQGFLLLLGSAGGTGSGIGSRMIEFLRDEYNTKSIVAAIVLPFTFGEVCTQNYNTILALAKFCNKADVTVLLENEQIYNICTNLLKIPDTLLYDMNNIISENLLALLQPTNDARQNMNLLVSRLVSNPLFRFVTIKTTPHTTSTSLQYETIDKWHVYIRNLKRALRISKSQTELRDNKLRTLFTLSKRIFSSCVSNVLVTRGKSMDNDLILTEDLQKKYLYPDWITKDSFTHLHQERRILNRNKFLALITNNSEIHQPLEVYLDKAWNSYKCAAFLHQYKQFGLEEDDFLQAFARIENVVQDYKNLNS